MAGEDKRIAKIDKGGENGELEEYPIRASDQIDQSLRALYSP